MIPEDVKTKTRGLMGPLTGAARRGRLSPNLLTCIGLLLSAVAGYIYWRGPFRCAAIAVAIAGVFDVLDGEVARKSNAVTPFGAFLDSTLDRYAESFIWLGIILRYWDMGAISAEVYAFFALVGSLMVSYTRARSAEMGRETKVGPMERPERMVLLFIGTLFGVYGFVWFILALAIFTNLTVIMRILHLSRRRELR
jgi:CDP-diacylglycerol--glycerol-3-phosphate 3-phosphatidyltransferase